MQALMLAFITAITKNITMPRRTLENRHIRSLVKTSGGKSYSVTLPIEFVRQLNWKARQKLEFSLEDDTIIIREKKED